MIQVEVAYANEEKTYLLKVAVLPNSTIEDAIRAAKLLELCPEIDFDVNKVGVFSQIRSLHHRLKPNDRVEIYRPLHLEPKAARVLRVKKIKKSKKTVDQPEQTLFSVVTKAYGLGDLIGLPRLCMGGLLHRVFRIKTEKGHFVIKILNPTVVQDRAILSRYESNEFLVDDLIRAGVPAVPAIKRDGEVVFSWKEKQIMVFYHVKGKIASPKAITEAQAEKVGESLALIHRAKLNINQAAPVDLFTGLSVDEEELHAVDEQTALLWKGCSLIAQLQKICEKYQKTWSSDLVVSHRDADPKNILWDPKGHLHFIDWESMGLINKTKDIVVTALYWSFDERYHISENQLSRFLKGYQSKALDFKLTKDDVTAGFYGLIADWLNWLGFNLNRVLNSSKETKEYILGKTEVKKTIEALPVVVEQLPLVQSLFEQSGFSE